MVRYFLRSGSLQRTRAIVFRSLLATAFTVAGLGIVNVAGAAELDLSVDSVSELSGLTAVVAHSDDGVNLRAEPALDAEILVTLPDGTVVELRVADADTVLVGDVRWWPVRFEGQDGWIAGSYLEQSDLPATADSSPENDGPDTLATGFAAGDLVAVNTGGDGLAMRTGPSTSDERIASLGDGDVVEIVDGPFSDENGDAWYLITDGDISAYVFGAYLAGDGDHDVNSASVSGDGSAFAPGDWVAPAPGTDGVNVRSRASVNSRRLGSVAEGSSVLVADGPIYDKAGDSWYLVEFGSETGYMFGDLLIAGDSSAAFSTSGPTGTFIYPLESYVFTQEYGCTGYSFEPYNANLACNFHNGIDLAAPSYTPLLASDGGTVIAAGWCDCGLGFYVEIDHGNGFATVYGHMAEQPYVSVGEEVNQGDVIGPIGSTGLSTGPHVHFMLKVNGVTVDPLGYL